MQSDQPRVLMLGPPGSGKGTQGKRLAARHDVVHLSSGELLRTHVANDTALGRAAAAAMSRGDLIDDDLVISMITGEVIGPGAPGGFVLDGFPRTVAQAKAAYEIARQHGLTFHAVVLLDIPYEELLARLTVRGAESGRKDDTADTIRHRIDVYHEQTRPLIDYYAGRDILVSVDGTGTIDDITARINARLDPLLP